MIKNGDRVRTGLFKIPGHALIKALLKAPVLSFEALVLLLNNVKLLPQAGVCRACVL